MALLKILNGDASGVSYAVGNTALKVGRAEGNDLQLPDVSVSSRHCEIWVDSMGNLLVKDLGSTNGTFVGGQRVTEAFVAPGQKLRLGNLEFLFEGEAGAAPVAQPAVARVAAVATAPVALNMPPPPVAQVVRATAPAVAVAAPVEVGPNDCLNHGGTLAALVCGRCGKKWCKMCTKQQKLGMQIVDFCPSCGGQCKKAAEAAREAAAAADRPKSFTAAVMKSFQYPFKGNGLILLITGTIFYAFMDTLLGLRRGIITIYSLVVFVITYGYLFAYMQKIVVCSAAGDEDPPGWPEVSDIGADIVQPFFQLLITLVVSFVPAFIVSQQMGPLPGQFVSILGMIYFPMALLGVAMSDSYGSLNPVFVVSSILRAPKNYIVTCVAFVVLEIIYNNLSEVISEIAVPVLPFLIFWFLFLMCLIIAMRILGLFYFMNRRELGWGV